MGVIEQDTEIRRPLGVAAAAIARDTRNSHRTTGHPEVAMPATSTVLLSLEQALDAPHDAGATLGQWRWTVRQRMAGVRDALIDETDHPMDGWLVARGGAAIRERNTLLDRLTALGTPVLESVEVDKVRSDLKRLLTDISHHFQRLHDLAYDEVELELGGSE
jgi:hypothetical protein